MTDLTQNRRGMNVKIVGQDSSNVETIPVDASANGLNVDVKASVLPTGAATSANQATANTSLASLDTKTPALVSGRQPVDGSGVTQPVSAASLPLPTGAATSAYQAAANTSLSSIDAGIPAALGAATIANSMPVTIASDQVVPVSATALPLPTGAATSALQSTLNTTAAETHGTVAPGTAATKSDLIGGVYNSSLPTLTNGQQVALQLDSSGRQILSPQAFQGTPGSAPPSGLVYLGGESPTSTILPLQVDSAGALKVSGAAYVSLANFHYDDMNVSTGGVARATSFVVGTLTTLYSLTGAGAVFGFILNLGGLGTVNYQLFLTVDGTQVFGSSGISTADLLTNTLYDIGAVAGDVGGFLGFAFPDKSLRWAVPGGGQVQFTSSIQLKATQTAGGAQKFNAGVIALIR